MKINIIETEYSKELAKKTKEAKEVKRSIARLSSDGTRLIGIDNKANLSKIIVPIGVTVIDECAFANHEELEEIVLPDSVETIGRNAFMGCTKLKKINCPKNLKRIGSRAFFRCEKFEHFNFPEEMDHIYAFAFNESGLKNIKLPRKCSYGDGIFAESTIEQVEITGPLDQKDGGSNMFQDCTCLKRVVFSLNSDVNGKHHNNKINIPDSCFIGCKSLRRIDLRNVLFIGDHAFSNCSKLNIKTIPSNICNVGHSAFNGCDSIKELTIKNFNALYDSIAAFDSCHNLTKVIINVPNAEEIPDDRKHSIPTNRLSYGLFYNCSSLKDVIFIGYTDQITGIETRAFARTAIEEIKLPQKIQYIKEEAFAYTNLKSIDLPESVCVIGDSAFKRTDLVSVKLPDSVIDMYDEAFENCDKLKSVTFSKNLNEISSRCFAGCSKLSEIKNYDSVAAINEAAFRDCISLKSFDFSNIVQIASTAFMRTGLTEVVLSDNFGQIFDAAFTFTNCPNLKLADFSACQKMYFVSEGIFDGCVNLETVKLPNTIERFESCCFKDTNLKEIYVPQFTESIETNAFCTKSIKKISFDPKCNLKILAKDFACFDTVEELNISDMLYDRFKDILQLQ